MRHQCTTCLLAVGRQLIQSDLLCQYLLLFVAGVRQPDRQPARRFVFNLICMLLVSAPAPRLESMEFIICTVKRLNFDHVSVSVRCLAMPAERPRRGAMNLGLCAQCLSLTAMVCTPGCAFWHLGNSSLTLQPSLCVSVYLLETHRLQQQAVS